MVGKKRMITTLKWMAGALGLAAGAYAGYVGVTLLWYGRPAHARAEDLDPLLEPLKAEAERRAAVRRSADIERVAQVAVESIAR